ncbi:nucleotidyltransferase [Clostridium grantii]|uniref:tRNA(Met) cytidine acetate ligase n=1 Tax=Clostridium grantii DSM 8605 TaxID=1121316 RepID=A0A1M5QVD2_9CLOT|nr:nucleotidyltransferase [Clostridium grantii]SHH17700.1 Predicted nucleotidyltransferase [Clostridium grantii DSM 8605]
MNITGVITEYNPMHNGHVYHINESKKITNCDAIICVMSGHFAQRGIPTILDKWTRTDIALKNGVDLVIELPAVYSTSSAEFFSFGSVSILNSLNCVDSLVFGSECGDIDTLKLIASVLTNESPEFKEKLSFYLNKGLAFPKARTLAFIDLYKNETSANLEQIMNSSNNILGIEYCKALNNLNSKINPVTIMRKGSSYNEENLYENYSSATSIRKFLKSEKNTDILSSTLPIETLLELQKIKKSNFDFPSEENFFPYLKYKLLSDGNSILRIPDAYEGLGNKILKEIGHCTNYSDLIDSVKSKRYTRTRINRILCQYLLNFDSYDLARLRKTPAPYARILGFNKKGREILSIIKKSSDIPLISKVPSKTQDEILLLDLHSTKIYSLFNSKISYNDDFLKKPIISI